MKLKLFLTSTMLFLFSTLTLAELSTPTQMLLPEPYAVFTDGTTVLNHPEAGFTEVLLPTINLYKGTPGCYIACYSHQKANSVYPVEGGVYVMGQVRVAGKYAGRVCEPINFAGKDISGNDTFKAMCNEKIEACKAAHCWAGGDTGGWFGIL